MSENRVLALFKFGARKHIDELVNDGHLFMNPLSYFMRLEGDRARSDRYEGSLLWMQPEKAKLAVQIGGEYREIPGILGPMTYTNDAASRVNVYCLYALCTPRNPPLIDPRNFQFGDTFAVFTDGDEFLRRVRRAALAFGHQITWRLVNYVEPATHHGPTGVFTKSSAFAYQSEARLKISPGIGRSLSLKIGSLADITLTGELETINERLRLA